MRVKCSGGVEVNYSTVTSTRYRVVRLRTTQIEITSINNMFVNEYILYLYKYLTANHTVDKIVTHNIMYTLTRNSVIYVHFATSQQHNHSFSATTKC